MSKSYCEKFKVKSDPTTTPEMRLYSQRPGKVDQDGNIVYFTEQAHKDTCNINKILQKYDRNGLISHVSRFEAQFGDVTGIEFKTAQDKVIAARNEFDALPSNIRNRFKNDPSQLLSFMDNPSNRDEAIKLGIIRGDWTPETDGLGEHIPQGGNEKKPAGSEGA